MRTRLHKAGTAFRARPAAKTNLDGEIRDGIAARAEELRRATGG